jgi:guanylate kinase
MPNNHFSIIVSAPSGAGKTTLIRRLLSDDDRFTFAISTTTRERRRDETGGKSYYFTSQEEFFEMIRRNEFLEWAVVHQNYYGTTKKEIDRIKAEGKIPIFDVDVQGARQLKGRIEDAVFIFIFPPSPSVLRERLSKRETETPDQKEIRLQNALKEMRDYRIYDYIIINDVIEDALSSFKAVLAAEMCRTQRMESRIKHWGL